MGLQRVRHNRVTNIFTFRVKINPFSSVSQLCPTLCDPMDCSTPGLSVHHQLPEFTQTHVHWVVMQSTISSSVVPFSSHLQSSPASGSFQWVNSSHQVANIWSFSFSIRLSNEYSGLISFRIDWLDLLTVQGTLKSLLSALLFLVFLSREIWEC